MFRTNKGVRPVRPPFFIPVWPLFFYDPAMKNLLISVLLLAQAATPAGGLTLRGRVINENAVPCPTNGGNNPCNVSQGVYLSSDGRVIQTVSVPSKGGNFQFRDLRPGRYFVTLEPNDASLPPAEVVLSDKNIDDLQIRIPSSVLRGTLSVEGNGPMPSIRLVLNSMTRGEGSRSFTLNESTFSFPQIPIGVYTIEIQGLPTGYSVKSVTAGTSNLLLEKLGLTAANPPVVSILLAGPSQSR
jgi:hypothetical protein